MNIRLSKQAEKFLKNTNEPIKGRIIKGIKNIPNGDIKPLKGVENKYRLRIGDYRVVYTKNSNEIYEIYKIQKRNDIYKRGV